MEPTFEKITTSVTSSFRAYRYQKKEFDAPWHFHPEYELTLIRKSKGIRYVGNHVERFVPGDLVLIPPNVPHCWKNTAGDPRPSEAIVIQWRADVFGKGWQQKIEFAPIAELLERNVCGIQFDSELVDRLLPELKRILGSHGLARYISFLKLLKTLAGTKKYRSLSSRTVPGRLDATASRRIDTIQNFVTQHYQRKITLGEMATLTHMSEAAFCRFFKRIFGKTFFAFLNEYKIQTACALLATRQQQVAQVAYACGYESLPFFYRQFKKFTGTSPLQYQKNNELV